MYNKISFKSALSVCAHLDKHSLFYQWESSGLVNKFSRTAGKLGGKRANSDLPSIKAPKSTPYG